MRKASQFDRRGSLSDRQGARRGTFVIDLVHRARHRIDARVAGCRRRAVVGEVHRQARRFRRRRRRLGRAVVDVRQFSENNRRRGLSNHQGARGHPLPIGVVHPARHRIAPGVARGRRRSVVGEVHRQARRHRRRRRALPRPVVGLRQPSENDRRNGLADRQRPRGRTLPVGLVHRARHRIAAHHDRRRRRSVVGEVHRQARRRRRRRRAFRRPVVDVIQIAQRHRRGPLADRQRPRGRTRPIRIVHGSRHRIAAHFGRRVRQSVVGEVHRQTRRHRRRRRGLGRAVVGLRQALQRHRRRAHADRQRPGGRALPVRLVHGAGDGIAAARRRGVCRPVVGELHRQARRRRRRRRAPRRGVVGLRQVGQRHRRGPLANDEGADIRALVHRLVDRAGHGIAARRRRRRAGPIVGELHRQPGRHRRRRRALRRSVVGLRQAPQRHRRAGLGHRDRICRRRRQPVRVPRLRRHHAHRARPREAQIGSVADRARTRRNGKRHGQSGIRRRGQPHVVGCPLPAGVREGDGLDHLRDRVRGRRRSAINGVVDGAGDRVGPDGHREGGASVVRRVDRQAGRNRRDRGSMRRAIVHVAQIAERDRRIGLRHRESVRDAGRDVVIDVAQLPRDDLDGSRAREGQIRGADDAARPGEDAEGHLLPRRSRAPQPHLIRRVLRAGMRERDGLRTPDHVEHDGHPERAVGRARNRDDVGRVVRAQIEARHRHRRRERLALLQRQRPRRRTAKRQPIRGPGAEKELAGIAHPAAADALDRERLGRGIGPLVVRRERQRRRADARLRRRRQVAGDHVQLDRRAVPRVVKHVFLDRDPDRRPRRDAQRADVHHVIAPRRKLIGIGGLGKDVGARHDGEIGRRGSVGGHAETNLVRVVGEIEPQPIAHGGSRRQSRQARGNQPLVVVIALARAAARVPGTIRVARPCADRHRHRTGAVAPAGKRRDAYGQLVPPGAALQIGLDPTRRRHAVFERLQHLGAGRPRTPSEQRQPPQQRQTTNPTRRPPDFRRWNPPARNRNTFHARLLAVRFIVPSAPACQSARQPSRNGGRTISTGRKTLIPSGGS